MIIIIVSYSARLYLLHLVTVRSIVSDSNTGKKKVVVLCEKYFDVRNGRQNRPLFRCGVRGLRSSQSRGREGHRDAA